MTELGDAFEYLMQQTNSPPRDWCAWMNQVEDIYNKMEVKGMQETKGSGLWFRWFGRKLRAFPDTVSWLNSFKFTNRTEIEVGTLKFREVAAVFRQDFSREMTKGKSLRVPIVKGSFLGYAGSSEGRGAPGDALESEELNQTANIAKVRRTQGKVPNKRNLSQMDSVLSLEMACSACDAKGHVLEVCWHTFPEKAPQWFQPNPVKKRTVETQLAGNSALKEEVERIRKRVRFEMGSE